MRDYSFGNFLHELRERRGLSQYQLGMLVGVSDKAVSKWENGSAKPQIKTLYKLSEVLGITVDELLACKYHSVKNRNEKGVFAMKICIRHMRIEFYFTFRFPKTNVPGYVSMSAR